MPYGEVTFSSMLGLPCPAAAFIAIHEISGTLVDCNPSEIEINECDNGSVSMFPAELCVEINEYGNIVAIWIEERYRIPVSAFCNTPEPNGFIKLLTENNIVENYYYYEELDPETSEVIWSDCFYDFAGSRTIYLMLPDVVGGNPTFCDFEIAELFTQLYMNCYETKPEEGYPAIFDCSHNSRPIPSFAAMQCVNDFWYPTYVYHFIPTVVIKAYKSSVYAGFRTRHSESQRSTHSECRDYIAFQHYSAWVLNEEIGVALADEENNDVIKVKYIDYGVLVDTCYMLDNITEYFIDDTCSDMLSAKADAATAFEEYLEENVFGSSTQNYVDAETPFSIFRLGNVTTYPYAGRCTSFDGGRERFDGYGSDVPAFRETIKLKAEAPEDTNLPSSVTGVRIRINTTEYFYSGNASITSDGTNELEQTIEIPFGGEAVIPMTHNIQFPTLTEHEECPENPVNEQALLPALHWNPFGGADGGIYMCRHYITLLGY